MHPFQAGLSIQQPEGPKQTLEQAGSHAVAPYEAARMGLTGLHPVASTGSQGGNNTPVPVFSKMSSTARNAQHAFLCFLAFAQGIIPKQSTNQPMSFATQDQILTGGISIAHISSILARLLSLDNRIWRPTSNEYARAEVSQGAEGWGRQCRSPDISLGIIHSAPTRWFWHFSWVL